VSWPHHNHPISPCYQRIHPTNWPILCQQCQKSIQISTKCSLKNHQASWNKLIKGKLPLEHPNLWRVQQRFGSMHVLDIVCQKTITEIDIFALKISQLDKSLLKCHTCHEKSYCLVQEIGVVVYNFFETVTEIDYFYQRFLLVIVVGIQYHSSVTTSWKIHTKKTFISYHIIDLIFFHKLIILIKILADRCIPMVHKYHLTFNYITVFRIDSVCDMNSINIGKRLSVHWT
jgi:hypothetical protein